jgi:hypothetical protein
VSTFSNPTDIFMRIISINYPKEQDDNYQVEQLVLNYNKRCLPGVIQHMNEISMVEFKPRTDNFSEPSFSVQLSLLMSRQKLYL